VTAGADHARRLLLALGQRRRAGAVELIDVDTMAESAGIATLDAERAVAGLRARGLVASRSLPGRRTHVFSLSGLGVFVVSMLKTEEVT
jgi:DNA-binding IscR family transcriptional regulator